MEKFDPSSRKWEMVDNLPKGLAASVTAVVAEMPVRLMSNYRELAQSNVSWVILIVWTDNLFWSFIFTQFYGGNTIHARVGALCGELIILTIDKILSGYEGTSDSEPNVLSEVRTECSAPEKCSVLTEVTEQ